MLSFFDPPYQSGIAAVTDDFAQIAFDIDDRVSLRQSGGIIIRKKNCGIKLIKGQKAALLINK